MKKIFGAKAAMMFLLILFCMVVSARAESLLGVKLSGSLNTDNRMYLKNGDFSWQEYGLDLKIEANPTKKAKFVSEIWIRTLGFSTIQSSTDLVNEDNSSPLKLNLRELYVDIYGVFFDNIDMRLGRQRISWGTADKLNPTDNLNPDDLEDIWDFGRHLSSDGVKASCYLADLTLTVVYIPVFRPAVMPEGEWAAALSPAMELPAGLILKSLSDTIILPANNPGESSITGVKMEMPILGYDFSVSYVYGRDDLPVTKKVIFSPTAAPGEVDIATELVYPRMNIIGMDMAGAIADIGIWAEAAVFFPEKIIMTTDLSALAMGVQESTVLDSEPYVKYVVGLDYTFGNGIYINAQYLHGFIHERGTDNLEDYIMFGMEWKLFDDKLKIIPISGGIEIKNYDDIENNYALILSPQISIFPVDNSEIILGARWIDGNDATGFAKVKENDELYLKIKYSF